MECLPYISLDPDAMSRVLPLVRPSRCHKPHPVRTPQGLWKRPRRGGFGKRSPANKGGPGSSSPKLKPGLGGRAVGRGRCRGRPARKHPLLHGDFRRYPPRRRRGREDRRRHLAWTAATSDSPPSSCVGQVGRETDHSIRNLDLYEALRGWRVLTPPPTQAQPQ